MVKLLCAIAGEAKNAFEVNINESESVSELKEGIKMKVDDITVPARKLQLFLAKKDDAWLPDDSPAGQELK
ncbi:hypothetical protein V7S43_015359 [Phytophthora oleae]|uniref:Crinkler effector protein N-terminal domain-containing protein n=1 Tax=Phytophthora oleae TaxID=2107226 RepID=A0ABD3F041_9STRA